MRPATLALTVLWLAAACGGGGAGDGGGDGDGPDAEPVVQCPVAAELADQDPLDGAMAFLTAQDGDPEARILEVLGEVGGGDFLSIALWDGYGIYTGGDFTTGPVTIEGNEATFIGCGACVELLADAQRVDGELVVAKRYIATSGTLDIASIDGTFSGSADGLTFAEVDEQSDVGAPLEGGCESALSTVSFSATIDPGA